MVLDHLVRWADTPSALLSVYRRLEHDFHGSGHGASSGLGSEPIPQLLGASAQTPLQLPPARWWVVRLEALLKSLGTAEAVGGILDCLCTFEASPAQGQTGVELLPHVCKLAGQLLFDLLQRAGRITGARGPGGSTAEDELIDSAARLLLEGPFFDVLEESGLLRAMGDGSAGNALGQLEEVELRLLRDLGRVPPLGTLRRLLLLVLPKVLQRLGSLRKQAEAVCGEHDGADVAMAPADGGGASAEADRVDPADDLCTAGAAETQHGLSILGTHPVPSQGGGAWKRGGVPSTWMGHLFDLEANVTFPLGDRQEAMEWPVPGQDYLSWEQAGPGAAFENASSEAAARESAAHVRLQKWVGSVEECCVQWATADLLRVGRMQPAALAASVGRVFRALNEVLVDSGMQQADPQVAETTIQGVLQRLMASRLTAESLLITARDLGLQQREKEPQQQQGGGQGQEGRGAGRVLLPKVEDCVLTVVRDAMGSQLKSPAEAAQWTALICTPVLSGGQERWEVGSR